MWNMKSISKKMKNIMIRRITASLVILGLVFDMEGVNGVGLLKVTAATSYPSEAEPGDSCSVDQNTQFAFYAYQNQAANEVENFNGSGTAVSGAGQIFQVTAGNSFTFPGSVDGISDVEKWSKIKSKSAEGWTRVSYIPEYSIQVIYNPNFQGGASIEDTEVFFSDEPFQLRGGEDTFERDGYILKGWSEEASGGVDYSLGGYYIASSADSSVNFFAVWERIPHVEVTYRPNGGTGSEINKDERCETQMGGDFKAFDLLGSADFTRTGYDLTGWKLTSSGEEFDLGDECVISANEDGPLVFDAIWTRKPEIALTVQYRPNGGDGDTITQTMTVPLSETDGSAQITLLDKADFEKSEHNLKGWSEGSSKYDLGATYSFTPEEDEISKTITFDAVWVEKKTGNVDIKIKTPVYVGAEVKYDIEKNSDGEVTVEFRKKDGNDSSYSKTVPMEGGKYIARAKLKETDDYKADEDTEEFEISYLDKPVNPYTYKEVVNSTGTVTDLTIVPVGGYTISTSPDSSFGASVLYSAAKKAGGVYLRRGEDKAITGMITLSDYTATDTPDIVFPDKIYYGASFEVTGSSKSPAELTLSYKEFGASDDTYTTKAPTDPGKYTARITAPATGFYKAVNWTETFTIDYLEAPDSKATADGDKGNYGWFKSDVKIKAPSGYLIGTSKNGEFFEKIAWDDKIDKIYYKRVSDGAITDAVDLKLDVKIDKDLPVVSFEDGVKLDESTKTVKVFLDDMKFTIVDDNLATVFVGGTEYKVENGRCEIDLLAGDDTQTLEVVATDLAGNSYNFTIEITPQWLENKVIPPGRKISLKSNVAYSFDGGSQWMVDGDNTVYAGGNQFYVKSNMSLTFSKK